MRNLEGKSAIIYSRVSTTEQKKYGNSLKDQSIRLRSFCESNNVTIVKEYKEDYSAKTFERPEYQKLFNFAKENKDKIDYLLVIKWDRFSRDTVGGLNAIKDLMNISIEVNSIENWRDYNDATQLIPLLVNLGSSEVENTLRSERVRNGNRRALKDGRWINMQPKGYVKGRDTEDKPLMQPDPNKSQLVTELFEDFSTGLYSQNEIRKQTKFKELNLKKSTMSKMLTQIAYAGKIRVPAFKEEAEIIVEALHKPLITIDTYNKVQYVLDKKRRYKQKPKKLDERLPLRGLLTCVKCGSNLTGSGSTSKTGKKHFYYHCNPKKGCGERFTINVAHQKLNEYLKSFQLENEALELFKLILEDSWSKTEHSNKTLIVKNKKQISELNDNKDILLKKLIKEVIADDTYKKKESSINDEITKLEDELEHLKCSQEEEKEVVNFGIHLIQNLESMYQNGSVSIKQKLLSSIFSEKLIFEGDKYRTPKTNKGFRHIYKNIKMLESLKQKTGSNLSKASRSVPGTGLEPVRTNVHWILSPTCLPIPPPGQGVCFVLFKELPSE